MTRMSRTSGAAILVGLFLAVTAGSAFASHNYVIANNNTSPNNTITVYELSGTTEGASLVAVATVPTGGAGIGGGYPANKSLASFLSGFGGCVYAGDAGSGDIASMESIHGGPFQVRNYRPEEENAATAGGLGIIITPGDQSEILANYTGNGSNIPPAIVVFGIGEGCELEPGVLTTLPRDLMVGRSIAWR